MASPFTTAVTEFVNKEDVKDRLILIRPLTLQRGLPSTMKGAKEGDSYDAIFADVAVLDGEVTDKIDMVPMVVNAMKLAGATLTPSILARCKIGKVTVGGRRGEVDLQPKDPDSPYVLGRLETRKSDYGTPMWVLSEFSKRDVKVAMAYLDSLPDDDDDDEDDDDEDDSPFS